MFNYFFRKKKYSVGHENHIHIIGLYIYIIIWMYFQLNGKSVKHTPHIMFLLQKIG